MMIFRRKIFRLSAAMFSALAIGRSAHAMSSSSIVSDALVSADWIAKALSSSGYRADFTLASLEEIDRFFDEHAPHGVARSGGLLSEDVGSRLFAIGSYIGETLRRQLGGDWIGDDEDPQAEINISLKLADGSIIWPIQRAMKRFRNGPEDSIAAYGAAVSRSSQ
ncbi:hypothetical protein [Sphingopyxis sp. PET50]|uniref:hypothetical protein n=1 Tax=Sphingopyxis sp. PET50 TaxID=2976533 RepID=UPI0021AE8A4A|nr:hypothetical protein [Sphingopyxis sp. PET50]